MTTVEALASGAPVVAVNDGNNPNLIRDSINGVLFNRPGNKNTFQTSDSVNELREAINKTEAIDWDHEKIQESAKDYDIENFSKKWKELIEE